MAIKASITARIGNADPNITWEKAIERRSIMAFPSPPGQRFASSQVEARSHYVLHQMRGT